MATEWYYSKNGHKTGPISAAELKRLAETRQINANDLVWRKGLPSWVPASKVKGLLLPAGAPPRLTPSGVQTIPPPPNAVVTASASPGDLPQPSKFVSGIKRRMAPLTKSPFLVLIGLGGLGVICACITAMFLAFNAFGTRVEYVFPNGYRGWVWILLDANGEDIRVVDGRYRVSIPSDGVVRVRSFRPLKSSIGFGVGYSYRYEDGTAVAKDRDPEAVAIRGWSNGVYGPNQQYERFFVGTISEKRESPEILPGPEEPAIQPRDERGEDSREASKTATAANADDVEAILQRGKWQSRSGISTGVMWRFTGGGNVLIYDGGKLDKAYRWEVVSRDEANRKITIKLWKPEDREHRKWTFAFGAEGTPAQVESYSYKGSVIVGSDDYLVYPID